MHGTESPSPWVCRWTHLIAPGGTALDVACGAGRHLRWLHSQGIRVAGVDRSSEALAACAGLGELVCADIEGGPWPFASRQFDAVVVTNYLWRPLLPILIQSLAPGGVLIYETFALGNETVGRPARPEFLLAPGELLQVSAGLRVVAYEDGFEEEPARFVQRITAVRELPHAQGPQRHLLPARTR
ncbi:class I SAM-dependent methyltransferase [Acidovorax sp.]|jgi:SAM-dependent methyltransferase|uniref:class I SAM-dependent methyltransferase n=1 Tax=Acidovorax sp. TaxID=1872122 RepID=UPI0025C5E5BB|nr:class I SAM-dependent methyltransferase [Acidovorax sp.]MCI5070625.1 class I SAM-dependent methyltransferase [Acidovorax sp.]